MTLPHHFNTTNFHSHGLHVSPGGISDNVFRSMEPGQSYDIEIAIPADHPSGHLLVSPASPRQRRCPDDERHGRRPDRRGRFRRCAGDRGGRAIACSSSTRCSSITAARSRSMTRSGRKPCRAFSRSTASAIRSSACGPARSSAGGSSMPGMRTICVSRWRGMGCRSSPMTESRRPRDRARTTICSWRRASGPMCWCRPVLPETTRFGRSPMTRATPRPSGRLARLVVEGEPLAMALPTALGKAPLVTIGDGEITNTRRLTLSVEGAGVSPCRQLPGVHLSHLRPPLRPQSGRSAHSPGRGRGMGRRQRA